jgi:hypothetical protein
MLFSHSLLWTQKIMITIMTIIMGGVWIIRRVLNWIYWQLGTTDNYSAIADLHTLQFTVTHALGFSVFTSRILATDLWQSHWNSKSYIKQCFHSPIPFLSLFCNCQLHSIPLFPSSYPGRLASRNSTNSNDLLCPFYNPYAENTASLLLRRRVYSAVA